MLGDADNLSMIDRERLFGLSRRQTQADSAGAAGAADRGIASAEAGWAEDVEEL